MQRLVSEPMCKITTKTVEIAKATIDYCRRTVRRLVALCHQAGRLSVPQGEYLRRKRSWLLRAFLGALITLAVIPSADVRRAVSAPPIGHELILHSVEDGAGPPELTQIPDWFCEGDQDGDEVGYSVGAAGDVNHDGYGDVIIGARHDTDGVSKEGVAYLFYGSAPGLSDNPAWQIGSGQQGALFGASVAGAGNVNGDDYDDIIVGAPGYKNGQTKTGAAFVFHGAAWGLKPTPDWTFTGDQKDANLGNSVGSAGDVNGDGHDDVIVGAPWQSDGQESEGVVFVFFGSDSGLSLTPDWLAGGGQVHADFGASVGTAGDVNGDGYSDVIVGAPNYDAAGTNEGAAFVFFGSDTGPGASPDWAAYGDQDEAQFGASVGTAGDVNGDGYDDIIVGMPGLDDGQMDVGAALVYYGSGDGLSASHGWMVAGDREGARFGAAVATAGDVDGDGYDDVVVGAPRHWFDHFAEGVAFVFHGSGTGLHSQAAWWAEGDKAETGLGTSVSTAGYVTGDGYADLVVGAPQYRHFTDVVGRALAYYGPIEVNLPKFVITIPLVVRASP
jgi:hypothetical protein